MENHMNIKLKRIFLAGGGDKVESRLIDEQFVGTLDLSKPLIYIPNAGRLEEYATGLEWLHSAMKPLGVLLIEMWADLRPHCLINEISGIYIGGGDTSKLLAEVRHAGFETFLQNAAELGIPIYGGSAGAIILGEDIRTAPEAQKLNTSEALGLQMIKLFSVVCHYSSDNRETIVKLSKDLGRPIIAIPEKSGAFIEGDKLTCCGLEPVDVVYKEIVDTVNPNETLILMD
jgi:dipeptidase E